MMRENFCYLQMECGKARILISQEKIRENDIQWDLVLQLLISRNFRKMR